MSKGYTLDRRFMGVNLRIEFVTLEMLKEKGACYSHLGKLSQEWPDGVRISKKTIRRASELGLDVSWFVSNFLTERSQKVYSRITHKAFMRYWQEITRIRPNAYSMLTPENTIAGKERAEETRKYRKARAKACYSVWKAEGAKASFLSLRDMRGWCSCYRL